ncbi:hypothetical protein TWF694_011760 [Orbilia ellipsospora]|uniref:Uncharacterized protein n=1 Tax=Orbilia ellipsospora TaxID=2528407 RepID=A0AAV9X669_9PEZI
MFSSVVILAACLQSYVSALPATNQLKSQEVVADFNNVPGIPPLIGDLIGDLFPINTYKGLKYSGFDLGNSPLGSPPLDLFSIDLDAPLAVSRFLLDDILKTPPSVSSTYPGSDVHCFDLHELEFSCMTTTTTIPGVLVKCTLVFTPYIGEKRLAPQVATFTPVPGSEIPVLNSKRSEQQLVTFGEQFKGITSFVITMESAAMTALAPLGLDIGVPSALTMMGMDNLRYTLYMNN